MGEEQENKFEILTRSSVKLSRNSKGINWEVRAVAGEEDLMEGLKDQALKIHNDLVNDLIFNIKKEGGTMKK